MDVSAMLTQGWSVTGACECDVETGQECNRWM